MSTSRRNNCLLYVLCELRGHAQTYLFVSTETVNFVRNEYELTIPVLESSAKIRSFSNTVDNGSIKKLSSRSLKFGRVDFGQVFAESRAIPFNNLISLKSNVR